jgi:hypothetical protein
LCVLEFEYCSATSESGAVPGWAVGRGYFVLADCQRMAPEHVGV